MEKVRAKFCVVGRTEKQDGNFEIAMAAVIGDNPENNEFFKYTPYGKFDMGLVTAKTAKIFNPGREFYLDFTPVPPDDKEDVKPE